MDVDATIFVAGADTLVGQGIVRALQREGYRRLVAGLQDRPAYVFVAAGKSGGIAANEKYPAELCLDNLRLAIELIPEAHRAGVKKLLYLASSCVYPKHCPQPMSVDSLWTGPLEPTSAAYATAKLAGMALCQAYRRQHGANFITAIPADVFGPGVPFSSEDSHVIPSVMAKMCDAVRTGCDHVTLWGTGAPRREFTFVDDLAEACLLVMREYNGDAPVNIGSGETFSIREMAELIRDIVGYRGEIRWDSTRPDGAPVKSLDTVPLRALGWRPRHSLRQALELTFHWHSASS